MAINPVPRDGRASCQQTGFCVQGCTFGAKWSTLYTEIPKAEATGKTEVRSGLRFSASSTTPPESYRRGLRRWQGRHAASESAHRLRRRKFNESPRLLLNSSSSKFPQGLANSSGHVGRNYMRHMTSTVFAIFDNPIHMYRGTAQSGIVMDEARLDTKRGFVGGYQMELLPQGLPSFAQNIVPGAWGHDRASIIDNYSNIAGVG